MTILISIVRICIWQSMSGLEADINYTTASLHHSQRSQSRKIKQWKCNVWNLRPCGKNGVRANKGTQNRIICKLMINKYKRICIGVQWTDFAVFGHNWSRWSNNIYCMPGENAIWGKKEVIFNCSPSPACPYDLVWCHDSLQPYTQSPSHFFLRRRSQELTQEIFTLEEALAFMPSWCLHHFVQWNKSSMQWHHNSTWPRQCPLPCPSACASHFARIIKTWGKQLVPTTVKSTVEVPSISHITSIGTVWERMANTDSCILFHSTMASTTANEWRTYTAVHTIILLWISENIMCEPTNRESLP